MRFSFFRSIFIGLAMLWVAQGYAQIQRSIVNPSFELPFTGTRSASINPFFTSTNWIAVDAGEIPGWETTHPVVVNGCPAGGSITPAYNCTPIELWANSYLGVVPEQGRILAELNAYQLSKLFQNICMTTGEVFTFNFAHRGRDGADRAQLQIGAANTVIIDVTTNTTGTGVINAGGGAVGTSATPVGVGWTRYSGSYTYTGAGGVQPLGFSAISSAGGAGSGNLLDDINIALKPYVDLVGSSTSNAEGAAASPPQIKVVGIVPVGGLNLTMGVGGTAALGSDFSFSGTTSLTSVVGSATALSFTVPAGNYSDALANNVFNLPITVVNDAVVENNETILLSMPANGPASNFVNANATTCGGPVNAPATHTIIDNDIDLRATKNTSASGTQALGSTISYTVTFANITPVTITLAPLTAHDANTVTISDPVPAGVSFTSWACSAVGTTCPAASGSGAISQTVNLPFGASLTYVVQANLGSTTLCAQTVTNTAQINATATSPSGVTLSEGSSVQGNAGYVFQANSASAATSVQPCAALAISKTDVVANVRAGGTTAYTIVVSNTGPSAANNALLQDPAAPGLACTSVACTTATGAASCASLSAVTLPLLQGSGIVLNNFPAGSSYTFVVNCNVTATGQ
jgi:uncharacterized repeat protein (TIGR01451 family)